MKYRFYVLLLLGIVLLSTMASCGDKEPEPGIKVKGETALTQAAYADETGGSGGVSFVAAGAWPSRITEGTTTKPVETGTAKSAKAGIGSWVSISPDHGDRAGSYTIAISLEPNYTGANPFGNHHHLV